MITRIYRRLVKTLAPRREWLAYPLLAETQARMPHQIRALEIELGQDSPLGAQGDRLLLPFDTIIAPGVLRDGAWDYHIFSMFRDAVAPLGRRDLIDLGANCGLFARQALLALPGGIDAVHCIEADPEILPALQRNLVPFDGVTLHNVGLGDSDRTATFYREDANTGNNSFLSSSVPKDRSRATTITMLRAAPFFERIAGEMQNRIVVKCDIQGFDELVLCAMPPTLWDRIDVIAVEISRIEKPPLDALLLKQRVDPFEIVHLQGMVQVSPEAFVEYAAGLDGSHGDFLLRRKTALPR